MIVYYCISDFQGQCDEVCYSTFSRERLTCNSTPTHPTSAWGVRLGAGVLVGSNIGAVSGYVVVHVRAVRAYMLQKGKHRVFEI